MARGSNGSDEREIIDQRGTGVTPLMIALGVVAVLFIIFLAQSTEEVAIEFLVWEVDAPLYVVLLVTMAASGFLTLAVAGIWRRRRRRQRAEHEELGRLRSRKG